MDNSKNDNIEFKRDLNHDNVLYQKEIESVINNKNTEKIWFNLEHDLINSRLKGKNARLMKRVGKNRKKK